MKPVIVKTYKTARQMQRSIDRMAERGYDLQSQSGEFSSNPFTLRWNRRKVIATFRVRPES